MSRIIWSDIIRITALIIQEPGAQLASPAKTELFLTGKPRPAGGELHISAATAVVSRQLLAFPPVRIAILGLQRRKACLSLRLMITS